ncbi:hypothetical protein ACROYT_G036402 [Oculina patagonica]
MVNEESVASQTDGVFFERQLFRLKITSITSSVGKEKEFHVVFASNSLLRIDCYMYKYQFRSEGMREQYKNMFCYYIQVGVLDIMKVPPQILLYELTRSSGDPNNLEKASRHLEQVAKFSHRLAKHRVRVGTDSQW